MKVIILAGGFGTRMSEFTATIPKPMVQIGKRPILWHIMKTYASFNHKDFYVALGYKAEIIKQFFAQYHISNSDFTINLKTGKLQNLQNSNENWQVTLLDTGINTMTGGRLKRISSILKTNEPILMTYGDGVSDVNISELINFHKSHGKMITMTAVRPPARFGELKIDSGKVTSFKEKPQLHQGWINGGYFVIEPEFIELITDDNTMLEREPLSKAAQTGELMAYKHYGFWQCMDTKRDHQLLEKMWSEDKAPWKPKR